MIEVELWLMHSDGVQNFGGGHAEARVLSESVIEQWAPPSARFCIILVHVLVGARSSV